MVAKHYHQDEAEAAAAAMAVYSKAVVEARGWWYSQQPNNVVYRDGRFRDGPTKRDQILEEERAGVNAVPVPTNIAREFKFKTETSVKLRKDGRRGEVLGLRWTPHPPQLDRSTGREIRSDRDEHWYVVLADDGERLIVGESELSG